MQTVDPLDARQWFTWRERKAWVFSGAAFAVLFFTLTPVLGELLALMIAFGSAFCLFFFYLSKRTIGIECPYCQNYIETNTPWICGVCGEHNLRTDDCPFIGRCQKCRAEPKAYQCHHKGCGELIFFTKDKQRFNFAKCVNIPVPKMPLRVKRDKDADGIAKQHKDIQITELNLKKAKLDLELKIVKQDLEPAKEMTEEEILQKSAERFMDRNTSGPKIVERWKAKNAEIYKDNPVELAKQNANADQWALNNLEKM